MLRLVAIMLVALAIQPAATPQSAAEQLLAADRRFAEAARSVTATAALTEMFASDVMMPLPGGGFARGSGQAAEALAASADNRDGRLEWTPVRAGVSADGQHGFTFGYMTLHRPDGQMAPLKYLAYWRRASEGWRVAAYKRARAEQAPADVATMAPSLPARLVEPTADAAAIARHAASLAAAERAFSDEAQKIGLGPAFAKYAHDDDAINLGPPTSPTVVVGAAAIGRTVGAGSAGQPSPVSWAADEGVQVASSGDLGVTFGVIRPNKPRPDGRAGAPFFTIWRRDRPDAPWRYIAE